MQKYIEEIFGKGMAKVSEINMAAMKGLHELTTGSSIENTLDLSVWPQIHWTYVTIDEKAQQSAYKISVNLVPEVLTKYIDFLFELIFDLVPFAKEFRTPPKDPPFMLGK